MFMQNDDLVRRHAEEHLRNAHTDAQLVRFSRLFTARRLIAASLRGLADRLAPLEAPLVSRVDAEAPTPVS